MGKTTPGPWYVLDNGYFFEVVVPWRNKYPENGEHVDGSSPTVCSVSYKSNDGIVGEHDAYLIAAAPELLETLRGVLEILPCCPRNTGIAGIEVKYNAAVVAAHASIAAATGETK